MKRDNIREQLKLQIADRAHFRCEYCLLPDAVSFYNFHVDHIRSLKHGGASDISNLAYCCPDCNYCKGSDIGNVGTSGELVRFFNPRMDIWGEHFELINGLIVGKTAIGKVTEEILKFNEPDRLVFRRQLIQLNQYGE